MGDESIEIVQEALHFFSSPNYSASPSANFAQHCVYNFIMNPPSESYGFFLLLFHNDLFEALPFTEADLNKAGLLGDGEYLFTRLSQGHAIQRR
jgi:hypothetical protein